RPADHPVRDRHRRQFPDRLARRPRHSQACLTRSRRLLIKIHGNSLMRLPQAGIATSRDGAMRKHARAVSIACGFVLGILALALDSLGAHGQSADLVLCDRLAADPTDPDKPADVKGVADIAPSDIATAIKFCRVVAPKSRRAMYQLGRAYAANG